MKNKRVTLIITSFCALAFFALLFLTPFLVNIWSLFTNRGFIIPDESSVFTFQDTEINAGSGEWWLYGEDAHFFYAQGNQAGISYIAFPRAKVSECPSFQSRNWTTWCSQFQKLHESK